jgi:bacterial/archaeal transporter family protein
MNASHSWLYWALLSAVFAALTAVFAKIGLRGIDSDYATLIRTAVITCVLAPFVVLAGKWQNPAALPLGSRGYIALSAVATGASWICYFRALQIGDASLVAPVDKLSVILVAALAFAFFGERPSPREWGGILLISLGAILIATKR